MQTVRIAAIDLGTNSFHLLVAEGRPDGSLIPLVREKEMLRLGDSLTRKGRIAQDGIERAVATLRRFVALAEASAAPRVVACATSALRDAANGAEVVAAMESATGIPVRIISGTEEARLVFEAVRSSVLIDSGAALCFDLGGGSLEIMVGDRSELWWSKSVPLGVARLTAGQVRHDPLSGGDRRRIQERLESELAPLAKEVRRLLRRAGSSRPALAVGSGGTLCDLGRMLAFRRAGTMPVSVNQFKFGLRELLELHDVLLRVTTAERRRMAGLDPLRADLAPAGSMMLAVAMECFGFDELTLCEWGLREGIVLDAVGHPGEGAAERGDIRRSSIVALARRCQVDEGHGRHVASLATRLFDQTQRLHGLGTRDRELLEYAALLHHVGEHISVLSHHKHTGYLIQHGRLRGFGPDEVIILAAVSRYGAGGDPKPSHKLLGLLDSPARERLLRLAALLRLADGLDRGRRQAVESVEVSATGNRLVVRVRRARPEDGALELWGAERKAELFEDVFDRRLVLVADEAVATVWPGWPAPDGQGDRVVAAAG